LCASRRAISRPMPLLAPAAQVEREVIGRMWREEACGQDGLWGDANL
jgi:hypothetical protein